MNLEEENCITCGKPINFTRFIDIVLDVNTNLRNFGFIPTCNKTCAVDFIAYIKILAKI